MSNVEYACRNLLCFCSPARITQVIRRISVFAKNRIKFTYVIVMYVHYIGWIDIRTTTMNVSWMVKRMPYWQKHTPHTHCFGSIYNWDSIVKFTMNKAWQRRNPVFAVISIYSNCMWHIIIDTCSVSMLNNPQTCEWSWTLRRPINGTLYMCTNKISMSSISKTNSIILCLFSANERVSVQSNRIRWY